MGHRGLGPFMTAAATVADVRTGITVNAVRYSCFATEEGVTSDAAAHRTMGSNRQPAGRCR